MPQTNAEFLRYYLSPDCDQSLNYDVAYAQLQNAEGEEFDLFVRLAYEFSKLNLTPREMRRASVKIANLAASILMQNVGESDYADDELIEAAQYAMQNARDIP